MEYRLLGHLEVARDGQPVQLRGYKPKALLAVLLLNANEVVTIDRLVDALWGDQPPSTARATVQYFVHKLRQALGGGHAGAGSVIATEAVGYRLRVEDEALDMARFTTLIRRARSAWAAADLATAAAAFDEALALWRGPAMADFSAEPFAQPVIARLEEQRLAVIEDREEVVLALGRHVELIPELEALLRAHPLRERLSGLLIVALYRSGRQVEALSAYQSTRRRMVEELGIEPGPELRRLEHQILTQDPMLAARAPPAADRRVDPQVRSVLASEGPVVSDLASGAAQSEAAPSGAVPSDRATAGPASSNGAAAAATAGPAGPSRPPATGARPDGMPASEATAAGAAREQRRVVTALVARVASPEDRTIDLEDARVRRIRAVERVIEAVSQYGGTTLSAIGGTILVVFGVPGAREDDAERAVRAALAICEAPDGRGVRVGVDTGVAIVAPRLGWGAARVTEAAIAAGVSGAVLDAAASLHELAKDGEVLVGQAAYRATLRQIDYEPAGPAWRPVAPRSRIGVAVDEPGPRAPLVERQHELALLAGALARVKRERAPQLVTVVGPPGIGKTRLVTELGRLVEGDPDLTAWRQGRSVPYGHEAGAERDAGGLAFWALTEILQAHMGIRDTDAPPLVEAKLEGAVADLFPDEDTTAIVAQLRPLVYLDGTGAIDADRRTAAFGSWTRFFEAVADDRPLVLVFEDLHGADGELLDFVDQLVDRAELVPLLVICTARPELLEYRPGWGGGKRDATSVSLGPLSSAGSASLLDALLAGEPDVRLDDTTRAALLDAAGGNPLFLEEYVGMLRLQPAAGMLPIPETLQQLITARLDRLEAGDRELLQDLSVAGDARAGGPLAALTSLTGDALDGALGRLERQALLRRIRVTTTGQTAYMFRHALIRDVVYDQLLRVERADKHRRVAEWLERSAARVDDVVELVAHHYHQALLFGRSAGQPVDAVAKRARVALHAAGDRAASLGAYASAARSYAEALALWPPDDIARPELLFRLGQARAYGEHAGEDVLEAAAAALDEAGRPERAAEAEVILNHVSRIHGDHAAAQRFLGRALARPLGPSRVRALALATRAIDHMIFDQHSAALAVGHEALDMARGLGLKPIESDALAAIGGARLKGGDATGAGALRQAIAIALAEDRPTVHLSRFDVAWGWWWYGDLAACAAAVATGLQAAERTGAATVEWFRAVGAGVDYTEGRWRAVLAGADRALASGLVGEAGYVAPWYHVLRGRIRAGHGDVPGAASDAGSALRLATVANDARFRQLALALSTRVALARGDRRHAADRLEELLGEQAADPERACVPVEEVIAILDLDAPVKLPDGLLPTRWHDAARTAVDGDLPDAIDRYEAIGAAVEAAHLRVRLAKRLRAAGRPDAAAVAARAAEVFAAAGATAWLQGADPAG